MSSRRLGRPARRCAGLAVALIAAGCTPSQVYVPPEWSTREARDAGFRSAVMLDATHVVFSWRDGRYRPVAPDELWRGGQREYVRDEKLIGIYDLEARTGRIVYSRLRARKGDGNGDLALAAARGGFALVFGERTTETGILIDPGGWFLLDLAAGTLRQVDLAAALEPRSLELAGAPTLVGDEGALLVRARWPGTGSEPSEHAHLLLLQPDGAVTDLGVGELLGEAFGHVFVGRPARGGADAFDVHTGELQGLSSAELDEQRAAFRVPEPTAVYVAEGGAHLWLGAGPGAKRGLSELAFDVEALR